MLSKSKEIVIDRSMTIVTRTNEKGLIEYVNRHFLDISGYALGELINQPHNIIRHPDMPSILFKLMWQRLQSGRDIFMLVKNKTKQGNFYWVTTHFKIKRSPLNDQITGYVAYRHSADVQLIRKLEPLYHDLRAVERISGIEASERYFNGFLESEGLTYDKLMERYMSKKTFLKILMSKMTKKLKRY